MIKKNYWYFQFNNKKIENNKSEINSSNQSENQISSTIIEKMDILSKNNVEEIDIKNLKTKNSFNLLDY